MTTDNDVVSAEDIRGDFPPAPTLADYQDAKAVTDKALIFMPDMDPDEAEFIS